MFTGIIEGSGRILAVRPEGGGRRLAVASEFSLKDVKPGDSIAVNGACLTAVTISGDQFEADVSAETVRRTAFSGMRAGDRVNLERAMRLSDRLDGHIVSGHIDGIGRIRERRREAAAIHVVIAVSASLSRCMIEKGSVAVDGVSLTINAVRDDAFEVCIIPHTASLTTVGVKTPGEAVNIETDMIGKYVERLLTRPAGKASSSGLDMNTLEKFGFL